MLSTSDLEKKLSIRYPNTVSKETNKKRLHNIRTLSNYIKKEINDNDLINGKKEVSLLMYETSLNEKIVIQFPGRESNRNKDREYPYDFKPKIIDKEGNALPDMNFKEMWDVLDKINSDTKKLMKCMSLIFFRMGRMINYELQQKTIRKWIISEEITNEDESISLELWYMNFDHDWIDFINSRVEYIEMFDKYKISYEAFICFFELILQNEDCKYYYKKDNLSSGRINTSDSMLLLSSYYDGSISIPTLLQKYVAGGGIGAITKQEISKVTNNKVIFYNPKDIITSYMDEKGIEYKENTNKTINKQKLSILVRDDNKKLCFIKEKKEDKQQTYNTFEQKGWSIIDLSDLSYESLIDVLNEYYR